MCEAEGFFFFFKYLVQPVPRGMHCGKASCDRNKDLEGEGTKHHIHSYSYFLNCCSDCCNWCLWDVFPLLFLDDSL